MTPEQFVQLAKNEHDNFHAMYFEPESKLTVASQIAAMKLNPTQLAALKEIVGGILTDVFYTWLLALDGGASFGGVQQPYILKEADGTLLTDGGELEGYAWEAFQE